MRSAQADEEKQPMALRSMTGFGVAEGASAPLRWRWELRSVNARGLDLRLRLPEGWDALEPALRSRAQAALRRGAVTAVLRVETEGGAGDTTPDLAALDAAIAATRLACARAADAGLALAPPTAEGLLRLPGVLERRSTAADAGALAAAQAAAVAGFGAALDALEAARLREGEALAESLGTILDAIAAQAAGAAAAHEGQARAAPARLRERVHALMGAGAEADPDRLAQELALLAIRQDVREELDRLAAHVGAARALLAGDGPAGRQIDFLTQEFNREVNTLCSKSDSLALTTSGLAMKVLVDQLREQAQNVE
jgi:uncharacterized protein (TIGR00255 family)